ncbi:MAG: NAD-dependent epimerase/dehydratase family protein [Candidatus Aminicenantes bacterium]|nr:NAD-dependent epimerase/dehydratase family protein [Candidatus Aminicenantes bacterium]
MSQSSPRILITGASGQIGTELLKLLGLRYGPENVLAADIQPLLQDPNAVESPFEILDVTDAGRVEDLVRRRGVDTVYHLAAVLSASGEKDPLKAWNVNIQGTVNILEAARKAGPARVFIPSSIAAFGPETPRLRTPQETVLRPTTIYGVTKVAGELLAEYYVGRFGLDVRGCRFPGIISHETPPGGGTTDYAVAIFYEAVRTGRYVCFLREDSRLPMMYMPDCLKSITDLMAADFSRLRHHADFNIAAMSFTPAELAAEIRKHIPGFTVEYKPDFRQAIADSWPESIDDSAAREEWGWRPDYDLGAMTADMIGVLSRRRAEGRL